MNCLTDAAQENPNEGKRFSRRDGLTVQITCRGNIHGCYMDRQA